MEKIERELKMSVPNGNPVLIEDMKEDLNPLLEPLLTKQLIKYGNELKVKIGQDNITYNKKFKLF